ncbi:MAG TPA: sialate O-acetylesterase [Prolixibacteraceae bacterium]|jgi:sialate O-acetylesterase
MKTKQIVLFFILLCFYTNKVDAQLKLPKIFNDNMVLQRDMNTPIWGTTLPGNFVTVDVAGFKVKATVDAKGKWIVRLPFIKAGGPYELKVSDKKDSVVFKNVLFGDVWLASGQSNMQFMVKEAMNAKNEIQSANFPTIRLINIQHALANQPQEDLLNNEKWQVCDPSTISEMSAVAYFFGREILKNENVPIGLINSSWGGTSIDRWTSRELLSVFPDFEKEMKDFETKKIPDEVYAKNIEGWEANFQLCTSSVAGIQQGVLKSSYSDKNWRKINLPGTIEQLKKQPWEGVAWYRKVIEIPGSFSKEELLLHLGKVDLTDITYINGKEIGRSSINGDASRIYKIPRGLLKKGKNSLTIRVGDMWGPGGFTGIADSLYISTTDGRQLSLAGEWKCNLNLEPAFKTVDFISSASLIYNAMVAPIIPFGIKGMLWYQGEADAGRAYRYRTMLPMMIEDWRTRWQEGNFPFLIVQLANYTSLNIAPIDDQWAELREAQLLTTRYPNVGMAVTIDIGDANNIHPTNKQEVGRRLALVAENIAYGRSIVSSGPVYQSMKIENTNIRLKFTHTGVGLTTKNNNPLKGFAIAGAEKKFYWAETKIVGDEIIVSSPDVPKPVTVRYAWSANPDCNLYNKEGLPAGPFRTDDWKGITE